MASKKIAYEPLARSSDEVSRSTLVDDETRKWKRKFWVLYFVSLLMSNVLWVGFYIYPREAQDVDGYPLRVPYHFNTSYGSENVTIANQLWIDLFPPGGGAVAIDKEWAIEHHIPLSGEIYPEDGRLIYPVAAYHQLHCLAVIRTTLYQFKHERNQITSWFHILHCIDTIRQAIQCSADRTISIDGVIHHCRDWEEMKQWTEEHAVPGAPKVVVGDAST